MATTTIAIVDRDSARQQQFLQVSDIVYYGDNHYCRPSIESTKESTLADRPKLTIDYTPPGSVVETFKSSARP